MKLLHLSHDSKIEIEASILYIREFSDIWKADKSKTKDNAKNEIAIVYMLAHHESPYRKYSEGEKIKCISEEMFNAKELPERVFKAAEKYKELTQTPLISLLESQEEAINKLSNYFKSIDWSERDKSNKPVYSPKEVSSTIKDTAGIAKALREIKQQILTESDSSQIEGGGELGDFEDSYDD